MTLRSDRERYGTVARAMHWVTALAILAMLGSGLAAERASGEPAAVNILRFHAATGVGVVLLTILRILWWTLADRRPAEMAAIPRWQAASARTVHLGFYAIILSLGASGVATVLLSGAGPVLSGAIGGPLPDFRDVGPRGPHGLLAWIMMALIGLHVGAALYHHLILRDGLLERMGIGGSVSRPPAEVRAR